ncbi:40s ribosomal protein s8 [Globisporangium polare]
MPPEPPPLRRQGAGPPSAAGGASREDPGAAPQVSGLSSRCSSSSWRSASLGCISRDSRHKRRETGGKRSQYRKKRKFELGRQPANTKLAAKRVHTVRVRGGHLKFRALRLDTGNFSWGTEVSARKTRILDVVYNASNNELVRTKTLVKNSVVLVDATPFRQWYEAHYGVKIGVKKNAEKVEEEDVKKSDHVLRKLANRQRTRVLDQKLDEQFMSGRLLAVISSRPGQSGRADGYILEGKELEFYQRKLATKKSKK